MNILVAIVSFIPEDGQTGGLEILRATVQSVREQTCSAAVHVALLDDGSPYLGDLHGADLAIHDSPEIPALADVAIDSLVTMPASDAYNKAKLLDHLLAAHEHYDVLVILDDDHAFECMDSLARIEAHVQAGYQFVVGRLVDPSGYLRGLFDGRVQGTTFAIGKSLLAAIGYFGANVERWGCGEDSETFLKVYRAVRENSDFRAIYDGNIVTIDRLSGRWRESNSRNGGLEYFVSDFTSIYGVSPRDNPSRRKHEWMEVRPQEHPAFIEEVSHFVRFEQLSDIACHRDLILELGRTLERRRIEHNHLAARKNTEIRQLRTQLTSEPKWASVRQLLGGLVSTSGTQGDKN